jgi:hypothetical protein
VKFPILISYAYARKCPAEFEWYANNPDVDVLLDSGAFTAKNTGQIITLDEYCTFLDKWKDRIFRYLALDVVGDPAATESNLQEMLRQGYKPVPVHVLGDDEKRMDYLFEVSDYVALAGLRRPGKGQCPPEYIKAKMKWAKGRQVHWLGYVRENMFAAFRPYSCDSASWAAAEMYGRMELYLGNGRWQVCMGYTTRDKLRTPEMAATLKRLGFTSKQFDDPNCWKKARLDGYGIDEYMILIVTADSWVQWVLDIQKRYGTRCFIATTLAGGANGHQGFALRGAITRHVTDAGVVPVSI